MEYTQDIIWQVWAKAAIVGANDPTLWRKEEFGAWIFRSDYENKDSEYGWVISRIEESSDDTNTVANLKPLHWINGLRTANRNSKYGATSDGTHNLFS